MNTETFLSDISLELATRAHSGTSFVPERRGEQRRQEYAETLAADFVNLAKYADTDEKRATLETEFARYREGYRSRYTAYLSARSACVSTMIAGPSNFPVRSQQKKSAGADKRSDELSEYRTRALDAITKTLRPELRPIMSGDDDAPERLREKIAKAKATQERMKEANAAIRKHAKAGEAAQIVALVDLGFNEKVAAELIKPGHCCAYGFASYELTNNGANIRRMEQRLEQVERLQGAESREIEGEHATFEDAPAENRVRLTFPGKPDEETRKRLKQRGFRWAPSLGVWQAYRNWQSLDLAREIAGIKPQTTPTASDEPKTKPRLRYDWQTGQLAPVAA